MTSPRHQYTDRLLKEMKERGIKITNLRPRLGRTAVRVIPKYEASFMTLIKLEEAIRG